MKAEEYRLLKELNYYDNLGGTDCFSSKIINQVEDKNSISPPNDELNARVIAVFGPAPK